MSMALWGRSGVSLALLASFAGCSRDATEVLGAAGGSGGAPLASAGAGGSALGGAGLGGAGGSSSSPDAGSERFRATLVTAYNFVSLDALDPVWIRTCEATPQLVQQLDGEWRPLRDDRPPRYNLLHEPHYLDGVFQSLTCVQSLGCDVIACEAFSEDAFRSNHAPLVPLEFVQVGTAVVGACPPDGGTVPLDIADAGDAGAVIVPDIQSRQPSGPLAVRVEYFRDSQCSTAPVNVYVPVE